MPFSATLHGLMSILAEAAQKALDTNPFGVFLSLLISIVLIILVSLGLSHRLKMRRAISEDRKAVLRTIERLNLPPGGRVGGVDLLKWLRVGGLK